MPYAKMRRMVLQVLQLPPLALTTEQAESRLRGLHGGRRTDASFAAKIPGILSDEKAAIGNWGCDADAEASRHRRSVAQGYTAENSAFMKKAQVIYMVQTAKRTVTNEAGSYQLDEEDFVRLCPDAKALREQARLAPMGILKVLNPAEQQKDFDENLRSHRNQTAEKDDAQTSEDSTSSSGSTDSSTSSASEAEEEEDDLAPMEDLKWVFANVIHIAVGQTPDEYQTAGGCSLRPDRECGIALRSALRMPGRFCERCTNTLPIAQQLKLKEWIT